MNRKSVSILLGIFSFIMMIGGLLGYLYHTDCCGLKGKCASLKEKCSGWKCKCCGCSEEE